MKKIHLIVFSVACLLALAGFSIESVYAGEGILGKLDENITLSGAVEVEASYKDYDCDNLAADDSEESDIALATVELGIDMDFYEYLKGHLVFLWQEDDTEPVDLDEGTITLGGIEDFPFYLTAGKLYVPFGMFNSHFISDPLTLELGETRESAALIGCANDQFDLSLGVFNGDIDETGKDNKIESFVAAAVFTPPAEMLEDLGISLGVSYISNIADSNGLGDDISGSGVETVKDYVGGLSAFLSASYNALTLEAEYLGALDKFEAGELSFDNGRKVEPKAWNFELAYAITEKWEAAIKYEGSEDLWDFLPEKQYGAVLSYNLFENTTVSIEYLHGEYENKDEQDLVTTQLAMEF